MKKVAAFCPCPKSLPEAKVKRFGLISLAEEISTQPSIDSAVWLSVVILTHRFIMKKSRKMYNLRRKRAPGSGMELIPAFKEIGRLRQE